MSIPEAGSRFDALRGEWPSSTEGASGYYAGRVSQRSRLGLGR